MNDTMTIQLFIFFAISTLLVSATPGSNMLFAFQCGLNHGLRHTLWAMAGLMLGLMILLGASLFGLSIISRYPWYWTASRCRVRYICAILACSHGEVMAAVLAVISRRMAHTGHCFAQAFGYRYPIPKPSCFCGIFPKIHQLLSTTTAPICDFGDWLLCY